MSLPPIETVLPHAGRAVLLRRILAHTPRETLCEAAPAACDLYRDPDGRIPVWLSLEWMAQCVAARAGLLARERGEPAPPGLFLGTRRVRFALDALPADAEPRVGAVHHRSTPGLVSFDCHLDLGEGTPRLAEARINIHPLPDEAARA